jgi:hypothetical protein
MEHRGVALGEDHAFAAACGAADEVGISHRFGIVVRNDLLGHSGYFSVGEEGKIEIGLLVAQE